jgi:hypothetical protein
VIASICTDLWFGDVESNHLVTILPFMHWQDHGYEFVGDLDINQLGISSIA